MKEAPDATESVVMFLPEVRAFTGLAARTLYAYERDGIFPRRRRLGPGRVGWLRTEVMEWAANLPEAEPVA